MPRNGPSGVDPRATALCRQRTRQPNGPKRSKEPGGLKSAKGYSSPVVAVGKVFVHGRRDPEERLSRESTSPTARSSGSRSTRPTSRKTSTQFRWQKVPIRRLSSWETDCLISALRASSTPGTLQPDGSVRRQMAGDRGLEEPGRRLCI